MLWGRWYETYVRRQTYAKGYTRKSKSLATWPATNFGRHNLCRALVWNEGDDDRKMFWRRLDETSSENDGPIQEADEDKVPKEPYPLLEGFEWVTMDLNNKSEVKSTQIILDWPNAVRSTMSTSSYFKITWKMVRQCFASNTPPRF